MAKILILECKFPVYILHWSRFMGLGYPGLSLTLYCGCTIVYTVHTTECTRYVCWDGGMYLVCTVCIYLRGKLTFQLDTPYQPIRLSTDNVIPTKTRKNIYRCSGVGILNRKRKGNGFVPKPLLELTCILAFCAKPRNRAGSDSLIGRGRSPDVHVLAGALGHVEWSLQQGLLKYASHLVFKCTKANMTYKYRYANCKERDDLFAKHSAAGILPSACDWIRGKGGLNTILARIVRRVSKRNRSIEFCLLVLTYWNGIL